MDLLQNMQISASGMAAQSVRMRVISENIANADSIETPEGGPYRRQVVYFKEALDRASGTSKVAVANITNDSQTPLKQVYDPNHPLADAQGLVAFPNVDTFSEGVDMREAVRAYEANMSAIEASKDMMARSIDILR